MGPHIATLRQQHRVTVVSSQIGQALAATLGPISIAEIPISRQIAPVADVRSLIALWRLFRRERFDVVQSITPKAGLLSMIAARLAAVPVRVHWFTGQVWATRTGAARWMLKTLDRVLAACATELLADSGSQRAFLVREGVVGEGRVRVLGDGSVCGVDTTRFRPDPRHRADIRARFGISEDAIVAVFLGRLNADKGVPELAAAFASVAAQCPPLRLLFAGPDEAGMEHAIRARVKEHVDRVYFAGETSTPERFLAAADFLVLPSHREGFGSTVIEAAACGIPTIGTNIYGLSDAVVDGETGVLIGVGDVDALAAAILRLATDAPMRSALGRQAKSRVEHSFTQTRLTAALAAFYRDLLAGGAAHP